MPWEFDMLGLTYGSASRGACADRAEAGDSLVQQPPHQWRCHTVSPSLNPSAAGAASSPFDTSFAPGKGLGAS